MGLDGVIVTDTHYTLSVIATPGWEEIYESHCVLKQHYFITTLSGGFLLKILLDRFLFCLEHWF